ncbi:MAG: TIGR01777 family oxidoreductase [Vicinamibacterales bacterium]
MRVVLAGGSGLLGGALAAHLSALDHQVQVLTRAPRAAQPNDIAWTPDGSGSPFLAAALEGADAVVNLAGEGIADARWTTKRKASLQRSRVLATRTLVAGMTSCRRPPRVFVSGSAVGFYGARGDEPIAENAPAGSDFLAGLCADWEREAAAADQVTRVAIVRTGLVLSRHGGALKKMLLPFKLGLGATLGSGEQFMPWIHVNDWSALVTWLITDERARGPFNGTAPTPATNADFTHALGHALHRPAILHAPGFVMKIAMGEMAEMLLTGQRVVPAKAEHMGFRFQFRELEPALRDVLQQKA